MLRSEVFKLYLEEMRYLGRNKEKHPYLDTGHLHTGITAKFLARKTPPEIKKNFLWILSKTRCQMGLHTSGCVGRVKRYHI